MLYFLAINYEHNIDVNKNGNYAVKISLTW